MNKGEKDIKTYPFFLCLHKQGGCHWVIESI